MNIGSRIAKLRKERNITQEALGEAVGVSGQAVSKWEKGGAPDVEMLPLIAAYFGVTIDSLFGRELSPTEDMRQVLNRWLFSFPQNRRMKELFRLLCSTFQTAYYTDNQSLASVMDQLVNLPLPSCYSTVQSEEGSVETWLRSSIVIEEGLQLGCLAEDLPLFLLLPEPEMGYHYHFSNADSYRALFSVLAIPGNLEILLHFYSREHKKISAKAVAKAVNLPDAQVEQCLKSLCEIHLLWEAKVETEDGVISVYQAHDNYALVPFLLLSRWLMEKQDLWIINWGYRKSPILRKGASS